MKREFSGIAALFIICIGIVCLNACTKDDNSPPVITVNGESPVYVSLNGTYSPHTDDKGATAHDNKDIDAVAVTNDISPTNPNVNKIGTYTITYKATDKAGNTSTATRIVIVRNDAYFLANIYNVHDTSVLNGGTLEYGQNIYVDSTKNRRIHFSQFANYDNNTNVYATINVAGDSIFVPAQTVTVGTVLVESHKFSGSGVITGQNFKLNYTDQNLTNPTTDSVEASYNKY